VLEEQELACKKKAHATIARVVPASASERLVLEEREMGM